MMKPLSLALFFVCYYHRIFVSGYSYEPDAEYVVITGTNHREQQKKIEEVTPPKIYKMQITSFVVNRYVYTVIKSHVQNLNSVASEATFSVIVPKVAYISEFVMAIGGKSYKAYVKEKQEARNIYDQAVKCGRATGHVAVTVRESNRFTVSVNLEALSKATFLLIYEELLELTNKHYELVLNIYPGQLVNDLSVKVFINESRPLKFVTTPPLRSGNEVSELEGDLNPQSYISFNSTVAKVEFTPTIERQEELAKNLGTDVSKGLSGQFVVQYEVERDPKGGEVLVKDGYFVHFFSNNKLRPLNKLVIFVLDTSGSMRGQKIEQLREAMMTILDQLNPDDYFHIVEFGGYTKIWNVLDSRNSCLTKNTSARYPKRICNKPYPNAHSRNPDNIKKAKSIVLNLRPGGLTNVYEALSLTMDLIESEKANKIHQELPEPIVMFLTDGDPTIGVTNKDQIIADITKNNNEITPIYCLSFGNGADKDFLKKLSQMNQGFSRHIYEAADAALQLQNFYNKIASPHLSDVKFEYVPDTINLTKTEFPFHLDGSELVVTGKLYGSTFSEIPRVIGTGRTGQVSLKPTIEKPVTSLERLWAYLTIQQLLDEKEIAPNKTANERKALDLALRYSFVTPITSLVVVKPNSIETDTETEPADKSPTCASGKDIQAHPKAFDAYWLPQVKVTKTDNPINKKLTDLKSALPWLENSLDENSIFKSPPGGYELGLNRTIFYKRGCSETPTHTTGRCELLHECPQIHHLLTTEDVFIRYFCLIKKRYGKFAGVCCP